MNCDMEVKRGGRLRETVQDSDWPAIWRMRMTMNSPFQRAEADLEIHDPGVDVGLRGRFVITFDEVGLIGRGALKGAPSEQVVHEGARREPQLLPQRFVIRLEHRELGAAIQAFLNHQRDPTHRDVLPLRRQAIVAHQRARTPRRPVRRRVEPEGS
jgi:hypothetical protein